MIEKIHDSKGGRQWKCGHCGDPPFSGWNATKALAHVTKERGQNIRSCKAIIPEKYCKMYNTLRRNANAKSGRIQTGKNIMQDQIMGGQEGIAESLPEPKKRKNAAVVQPALALEKYYPENPRSVTSASACSGSVSMSSHFGKKPKGARTIQTKLGNVPNPELTKNLDVAFSDWIHSTGSNFDTGEDAKLKHFLSLHRHAPMSWNPPPP